MPEDQTPTTEPDEPQEPAVEPDSGTDERTYTAVEYEALKEESIKHRLRAKEATAQLDTLREALQVASLRDGTAGILHDPESLPWSDDFTDEDTGLPDVEKIREAAEALADEKPWLSRPRGDVGQGYRGDESDSVDLASLLKAGA